MNECKKKRSWDYKHEPQCLVRCHLKGFKTFRYLPSVEISFSATFFICSVMGSSSTKLVAGQVLGFRGSLRSFCP
jgi:hypothetical protein